MCEGKVREEMAESKSLKWRVWVDGPRRLGWQSEAKSQGPLSTILESLNFVLMDNGGDLLLKDWRVHHSIHYARA